MASKTLRRIVAIAVIALLATAFAAIVTGVVFACLAAPVGQLPVVVRICAYLALGAGIAGLAGVVVYRFISRR